MKTKTKPQHTANGDAIGTTIIIDAELHVAKRYLDGKCYAIRFAEDMGTPAILISLQRFVVASYEWRPYDEGTNSFTDTQVKPTTTP